MLEKPIKSKELADWIDIATPTVRLWAKKDEYGQYLSPAGRGGAGRVRTFDDQDARVMAHIARLKAAGQSRSDIYATLDAMQSDDWQDLPPMPARPITLQDKEQILQEQAATAVYNERKGALVEITQLENQLSEARQQLEDERAMHKDEIASLNQNIQRLEHELGQAKGKLEIMEVERKSADYWLRIIVIIVFVTVLFAVGLGSLLAINGG